MHDFDIAQFRTIIKPLISYLNYLWYSFWYWQYASAVSASEANLCLGGKNNIVVDYNFEDAENPVNPSNKYTKSI